MKSNYFRSGDDELLQLQGVQGHVRGKKHSSLQRECRRRSQRALIPRISVKPQAKGFGS